MKFITKTALVLFSMAAFTACKKEKNNVDPEPNKPDYGEVKKAGKFYVHFNNVVGKDPIVLDSAWYLTDSKDSFTISRFSYYITNITLHTTGGSTYVEPNSYRLIDQRNTSSTSFTITDVPPGRYDSMTVTIGIDYNKTESGDQTGVLSPAYDMYWHSEYGYKAAVLEGHSPKSKLDNGLISYWIGGYKGLYIGNRTVGIKFSSIREINNNALNIWLNADAGRFFYGVYNVRLGTDFAVDRPLPIGVLIADNYARMFSFIEK